MVNSGATQIYSELGKVTSSPAKITSPTNLGKCECMNWSVLIACMVTNIALQTLILHLAATKKIPCKPKTTLIFCYFWEAYDHGRL